jgi:hypothetical protein
MTRAAMHVAVHGRCHVCAGRHTPVMAGLVPAIHVSVEVCKDVDARHKAGHDQSKPSLRYFFFVKW